MERAPSPPRTLGSPRWKFVCTHVQVFREICVNSSANDQQKRAPAHDPPKCERFGDQIMHFLNKRARSDTKPVSTFADRALRPFRVPDTQHSLQILPLRELERSARLGATVLLAFDHAR